MYTLDECARLWDEAGRHGDAEERVRRLGQWLPFYSLAADEWDAGWSDEQGVGGAGQGTEGEEALGEETPEEDPFVGRLVAEGLAQPGDAVLDVGSGVGDHALAFAAVGLRVCALDASPACLETLTRRALARGLAPVDTVLSAWEDYRGEGAFDLVFSAMCPAICNLDELRRMEACARRACCIVTVGRGSVDRQRKAMMSELGIRPSGGLATEALHYYNALYLMGRQPNVWCLTRRSTSEITYETLMRRYPVYFEAFGVERDVSREFLEGYFERNERGGVLHDEHVMNYAMVYWRVGGSQA